MAQASKNDKNKRYKKNIEKLWRKLKNHKTKSRIWEKICDLRNNLEFTDNMLEAKVKKL